MRQSQISQKEAGPDAFGYTVSEKVTLFYAYDVLIAFTIQMWTKWVFGIPIVLFGWFGIRTNVEKMVETVCHPGIIYSQHYAKAYGLQMND